MGESRRITVLLTNLVLVLACILGLELVVIGYTLTRQIGLPARAQVSTATRTASPTWSSTPSPTASHTPTPSLTPPPSRTATLTLTPTITPTPSETPRLPGPPTLTPAIPLPASDAYRLKAWTPTEADLLIQMMEEYPNALGVRDKNPQAYYDAYRFAVDARREALLRFPDAPQAHLWRWGLAYDLALMGGRGAGDVYAELIAAALNQRQTDLEGLPEWFEGLEPRQALYMVNATPPPGYIGSYVIEIRSQGSAFIWLLQSASAFQAVNLLTHFDYLYQTQANWILTDLDGNPSTGDEVAIYFSAPPENYSLDAPVVYSLSRMPPVFMPFLPERGIFQMGASYTPYWAVRAQPTPSPNNLYLRSTLFETCPVTVRQDYRWNQKYFPFQSQQIAFERLPDDLSRCEAVVNHAVAFWGPQAAIALMEQLLPYWPPAQDENGNPYPADERDEFLYRLGINHALVGNFDEAVRYMTTVASQPSAYNSRWIIPAKEFLRVYRSPQNIYTACRAAAHCDPDEAIRFLVASAPTTNNLLDYLWSWGVNTSSSGYFDFDGDEESERWFTVRNAPRQKLSYWILARYAKGVRALQVIYLTNARPSLAYLEEAFIADESLEDQPAVLLDGQHAFSMKRRPDTQEPYLVTVKLRKTYPSRFWFQVDQARQSLYSGLPPELVQDQLIELQYYPGLLCAPTWSCDPYYYLLGLSSELAGDEKTAVEAYHTLWSNYSRSPYTTLARLRLEGAAYVTPTPTTPPTSTPLPEATQSILTFTATATITTTPATSTVTGTITGTPGTPTPSSTPTPTVTGTPPTATLTPTITPSPTTTDTPDPYLLTTGQP